MVSRQASRFRLGALLALLFASEIAAGQQPAADDKSSAGLKEALKIAQDAEVKARLETIIADLTKPKVVVRPVRPMDGCERCGRG